MVLEKEEVSEPPVIGARRAGALPRAAPAAQGRRGAAAAVHRAVVEEEPPEVVVEVAVAGAVAVAVVANSGGEIGKRTEKQSSAIGHQNLIRAEIKLQGGNHHVPV